MRNPLKQAISQTLKYTTRRGLGDGKAHAGADVEHRHLDWRNVTLDRLDQRDRLLFLARVAAEGMCLAAVGADLLDQRLQLVGAAPRDTGNAALACKAPRDGTAGGVAGADHQETFLSGMA
jgi:hypothetical protein